MLTALEKGVKGGKWFSLIDKVSSQKALRARTRKCETNTGAAGVDSQTVEEYEQEVEKRIAVERGTKERDIRTAGDKTNVDT